MDSMHIKAPPLPLLYPHSALPLMHSSHLTILEQSSSLYPSAPAFRVPRSDPTTGQVHDWLPISYRQFKEDVEYTARYYRRLLKSVRIPANSVVGLWSALFIHPHSDLLTSM